MKILSHQIKISWGRCCCIHRRCCYYTGAVAAIGSGEEEEDATDSLKVNTAHSYAMKFNHFL